MSSNRTLSDVHNIHEVSTLNAATSSASSSSIGTGSPTLLNVEPLDGRSSPGHSHGTPSVKFAPLPQIDPYRKRSLAPLGVSARSRRKQAIQQEAGSCLWSTDGDVPEENMEDPLIAFAKFLKKAGKTLWRRMRKSSKAAQVLQKDSAEAVLDIRSIVHSDDIMAEGDEGEYMSKAVGGGRRASWSPSDKRWTLSLGGAKRRSTSDLVHLQVIV